MDVKNVFLHESPSRNEVARLRRSLYGLKQAPRAWFENFRSTILALGFTQSPYDPSLFLKKTAQATTMLLVYVDDIIITGTHSNMIHRLQSSLQAAFHMKDLGPLTYFLGLEVKQSRKGLFLHQSKYASDLYDLAGLTDATPVDTPLEVNVKLSKDDGYLLSDPTFYRRLVSSLVYLTITRPDISYAVNVVSHNS